MTLLAAAVAWLLSCVALSAGWPLPPVLPLAAAHAAILPARSTRGRLAHVAVAAAVVLVAAWRLSPGPAAPAATSVARLTGSTVTLTVRADADGDPHPTYTAATVRAERLSGPGAPDAPASGRLLVYLPAVPGTPSGDLRAGDELRMSGVLESPVDASRSDGYAAYLQTRGIAGVLAFPRLQFLRRPAESPPRAVLRAVRTRIEGGLSSVLPPREAALAQALVFGNRYALPADLLNDLRTTGTIHIATFSAFNVLVLYGALLALLAPLVGRRRAAGIALGAALVYGSLAGGAVSATRGELIAALLALATISGRPYSSAALLVLAAAGLCLRDPRLPLDGGFQLTFAAAAGVAVLAPGLRTAVGALLGGSHGAEESAGAGIADGLALSAAVTATILPVVAAQNGAIDVWSPLANAIANLLLPPLMALSVLAGALAALAQPLGWIVAAPLWIGLRALQPLLHAFAVAPLAALSLPYAGVVPALCWYTLLSALLATAPMLAPHVVRLPRAARVPSHRPRTFLPRIAPAAALAAAVVALAVPAPLLTSLSNRPTQSAAVWLDVTGPPALLVTGRNGVRVLISDNTEPLALAQALQTRVDDSRGVDVLVTLRGSDPSGSASMGAAVRAAALLAPASGTATARDLTVRAHAEATTAFVPVSGRAVVDLGGGDSVALLSDDAKTAVADITLGGRHAVVARSGSSLAALLARWDGAAGTPDVVVLPPLSGRAIATALNATAAPEFVLDGRWSAADAVIARSLAAAAGAHVDDAAAALRLVLRSGRIQALANR